MNLTDLDLEIADGAVLLDDLGDAIIGVCEEFTLKPKYWKFFKKI